MNALNRFQDELAKIAAEDRKMDGMGAIERAMHQIDLVYPDAEKKPKQQPKQPKPLVLQQRAAPQAAMPRNERMITRLLKGDLNR